MTSAVVVIVLEDYILTGIVHVCAEGNNTINNNNNSLTLYQLYLPTSSSCSCTSQQL